MTGCQVRFQHVVQLLASTDPVRRLQLLSATPTPSGSVLLAYRALSQT